jgi:hypothetical protein
LLVEGPTSGGHACVPARTCTNPAGKLKVTGDMKITVEKQTQAITYQSGLVITNDVCPAIRFKGLFLCTNPNTARK